MLLGYPGIDPSATNARMESALYRASGAALQMMVELMSPSEVRLTPVEIARQKGNKAVVALLEKFKKNPEQTRLDIRKTLKITEFPVVLPPERTWGQYVEFLTGELSAASGRRRSKRLRGEDPELQPLGT